jgi:ATP-dependent DNA helicase RecG
VDDLRLPLIKSYLKDVGSELYKAASQTPLLELGRQMNIVEGGDEFVKPRNVGILFFHDEPKTFLPGTQIDVVMFPQGAGGDELIEASFQGPLHDQVRDVLRYLQNNVLREKVIKHPDRAEATRFFNYPLTALKEALVNAVYHRGYDQPEPVEVRVNPEGIDIVSYPGPDASIRIEALSGGKIMARRYRNRRIGEFLKELDLTEGRCTGIPKMRAAMAANGSPPPKFSTDEGRTYFLVEIPVHPKMPGVAAHDEAHDEAHEELSASENRVLHFLTAQPRSRPDINAHLGVSSRSGSVSKVIARLRILGLLALTIPDKPQSKNQKMRITAKGQAWLKTKR